MWRYFYLSRKNSGCGAWLHQGEWFVAHWCKAASRALQSSEFWITYLIIRFASITWTNLILNNLSVNWENQCHRFWFGCAVSRTLMGIAADIRSLLVLFIKVGQENRNTYWRNRSSSNPGFWISFIMCLSFFKIFANWYPHFLTKP